MSAVQHPRSKIAASSHDKKLVYELARARADGRLRLGGVPATAASEQEIAEAEAEADYVARLRDLGGSTIPVTLRMPADVLLAVRQEAARAGVRYQTLIKKWIRDRLTQPETRPEWSGVQETLSRLMTTIDGLAERKPAQSHAVRTVRARRQRRARL